MTKGQGRCGAPQNTIFALATPPGRGALAVIRISGPGAFSGLAALGGGAPPLRMMALRRLICPETAELIDEALVVRFGRDRSFTGEDSVELQIHGSRAVAARIFRVLGALPGFRIAEPGEFTRRALLAGRMDFAQAESLADLVDAETELQRRQAMALLTGELSHAVSAWRARLVSALAAFEASLDFADEADVSTDVAVDVKPDMERLAAEIGAVSSGRAFGRSLREGFTVAIIGPPNAGKSTLLNHLAGEQAAITSAVPGTTRDIIRVRREIAGLPVWFLDTAGLRVTTDEVEEAGVLIARKAAAAADLRLHVEAADALREGEDDLWRDGDLRVWLKLDLEPGPGDLAVSARTGDGVTALLAGIAERLLLRAPAGALAATERQALRLGEARDAVLKAVKEDSVEIAVEHLLGGVRSLDQVVGRVDVEDVLDEVFSRFCIGK